MKVTVTPSPLSEKKYPYLGIRQAPYSIVLFTKPDNGMLLDGLDKNGYPPGASNAGFFIETEFTRYTGTVTLQN